jgi:hypothetical protein
MAKEGETSKHQPPSSRETPNFKIQGGLSSGGRDEAGRQENGKVVQGGADNPWFLGACNDYANVGKSFKDVEWAAVWKVSSDHSLLLWQARARGLRGQS